MNSVLTMDKRATYFVISVLIIFKMFGLFPLSLKAHGKSEKVMIISRSKPCLVYNAILIIITVYTVCFNGLPMLIGKIDPIAGININTIMDIASIAVNTSICIMLWTVCLINYKKMEETCHKLLVIDYYIRKRNYIGPMEFPLWRMVSITFTYMVIWIVLIWSDLLFFDPSTWFIWTFTYIISGITITLCSLQYAFVMNIIMCEFKSLNSAIERFGTETTPLDSGFVVGPRISNEDVNIKHFQSIEYSHRILYNSTVVISNFYSFPTLIIMGISCFTIISAVFRLVRFCLLNFAPPTKVTVLNESLWLMVTTIPIVILITTLENLTKEYERTPVEILEAISRFETCRRFSSKAKWFIRKIVHNPMEFTAFGFFMLDSTFFQSVLSTTVTYLIIILQFQSSWSQGKNSTSTDTPNN